MTPAPAYTAPTSGGWLTRAEAWLDARGKGAWIAAMVLGFIFFWPVGLAFLAYMIWSKRMFSKGTSMSCATRRARGMSTRFRSSGNVAFDSYKADMLRRLEEEQEAFEQFLERLREAKDKAEFDQFMDDRAKRANDDDAPKGDAA
ncbi:MAG: DUF2852 domain-containing protein [Pseudomonadota bacterium]